MMVDKTGVGPEGEGAVAAGPDTSEGEEDRDAETQGTTDPSPSCSLKHEDSVASGDKNPFSRTKSNQRWLKLRTTVQLSNAMQKTKPPLKREDSFLKRFSTRQVPETQETMDTGDDGEGGSGSTAGMEMARIKRRRRRRREHAWVVNPDENFYYYWLMVVTVCVLYNLWTLIVRQSFPELQEMFNDAWIGTDLFTDFIFVMDVGVQFRTGYLEQGLMVYNSKKLAGHYMKSRAFLLDLVSLIPLDLIQLNIGINPMLRFPRFFKVYRVYNYYYMVESRTVYPNLWRVMNLIHILLILAHWFGCFYYLLSEAEKFQGDWVYPYRPGEYATLTRKYLGSLYWSTLTLTTIGDLPTPESNLDRPRWGLTDRTATDGLHAQPRRGHRSRLLQFTSNREYVFTIVSYLIGVFIFATIVGQVGNVITNRNANRLEFERLLDGAKTYMRHHKVPGGMKRRVLRWYDYSWSRGRIQGGGDINTALGLLPDKLKTELALHVNLSVLKKVTIFQECQPEFLHDLVLKMKAYIFTPGDLICRKGEVAREMFIIADGILEVKSETGRVLTTMKAGDFFGEIGILNLDGLNRRTADVRSVGYSELFSLSREDVLAAMKDYPEAQDILQTLGRKRLMEARNMNRATKTPPGSDANKNPSSPGSSEMFDHKTGKRIVDKLRSDVIGLKNVLRKSRRGPRSKEEYMELQPLTSSQDGERYYGREGKGMLCRMPRVLSDDTSQEDEQSPPPSDTKLGAGLPLLNRLKLLKEKQDREAGEGTSSREVVVTAAPKEEPEVIGAGLPLIQRLLLLKQKEDSEQNASKLQTTATETAQVLSSTVRTQMRSPSISLRSRDKSREEDVPLKPIMAKKTKGSAAPGKNGGVSWKDNCEVEGDEATVSVNEQGEKVAVVELSKKTGALPKPKPQLKLQSLLKQAGLGVKSDATPKPATPVEKSLTTRAAGATILQGTVSDNTVDSSKETSKPGLTSEPQSVLQSSVESKDIDTSSRLSLERVQSGESTDKDSSCSIRSISSDNEKTTNLPKESAQFAQENKSAQSCSISQDNNTNQESQSSSNKDSVLIDIEPGSADQQGDDSGKVKRHKTKPTSLKLDKDNKIYRSIDDLSPEYSGLPFVKQLRILNERQKYTELDDKGFFRSSSLDSAHGSETKDLSSSNLTRSSSEAMAIEVVLRNQQLRSQEIAAQNLGLPAATSSSPFSPEGQLTSPESNETLERRQLKSILKKLSSTNLTSSSSNVSESEGDATKPSSSAALRKLMRAQTVEGYAARHSKLTKSVTFNRDTLQSPPSGFCTPSTLQTKPVFQFPKVSSSLDDSSSERMAPWLSSSLDTQLSTRDLALTSINGNLSPVANYEETSISDDSDSVQESEPAVVVTTHSTMSHIETVTTLLSPTSELKTTNCSKTTISETKETKAPEPRRPPGSWMERPQAKQKNFFRPGSILLPTHASQEEEFFGGILSGIKTIIRNHLEDIQNKFQTRFHDLEMEVRKRDDIIAHLQERIHELGGADVIMEDASDQEETSDHPFMRGDSVDTIISGRRNSMYGGMHHSRSWEDRSEEEDIELMDLPRSISPQSVWQVRSTSIEIESDYSVSGSGSELDGEYDSENNDWEIKMLAEEMERRESITDGTYWGESTTIRRRHVSIERRAEPRDTRRPLQTAHSLDESHSPSAPSTYRRSLSINSLHSSLSNVLGYFRTNPQPQPSSAEVPTISSSFPSPPSSPHPPPPPHPPDV